MLESGDNLSSEAIPYEPVGGAILTKVSGGMEESSLEGVRVLYKSLTCDPPDPEERCLVSRQNALSSVCINQ